MKSIDYQRRLRNWIGFLGMLLPVASLLFNLIFGRSFNPAGALSSISATHYSAAYLLFEGLVFGTGLFLFCYEGYDIKDRWATLIAGAGAITLCLFPTMLPGAETRNFMMLPQWLTNPLHGIGAAAFFGALIFILFFQFTKTGEGCTVTKGSRKWLRNLIYRVCAIIMFVFLALGLTMARFSDWGYWVYFGEAIALWAFGFGWLVKGGVWLKDV